MSLVLEKDWNEAKESAAYLALSEEEKGSRTETVSMLSVCCCCESVAVRPSTKSKFGRKWQTTRRIEQR